MPNPLIGKVVLVTGGSRGIGAAVVRRLASDGATVAFSYAASEDRAKALVAEIAKAGGTALTIQADSADADAVKAAVAQTVDRLGHLDILVNNAGILIGGIVDITRSAISTEWSPSTSAPFSLPFRPLFRTWVGAVGSSLRAVLPPTAPALQGRLFIR
jgi:NAD(P)-dependent dehydrogenase (short-subunit alcohol dehydrogenase family)